jgi:hypothetical protein
MPLVHDIIDARKIDTAGRRDYCANPSHASRFGCYRVCALRRLNRGGRQLLGAAGNEQSHDDNCERFHIRKNDTRAECGPLVNSFSRRPQGQTLTGALVRSSVPNISSLIGFLSVQRRARLH